MPSEGLRISFYLKPSTIARRWFWREGCKLPPLITARDELGERPGVRPRRRPGLFYFGGEGVAGRPHDRQISNWKKIPAKSKKTNPTNDSAPMRAVNR